MEGFINQTLWWDLPNGLITITFFARDIIGNVGHKDIGIVKDIIKVLSLEIVNQSFTVDAFNITFSINNITGDQISNALLQMFWNSSNVSHDINNLGNGYYFISLLPITVLPGEDPILLNISISASGYQDKHIKIYLAVDPDILDKDSGINLADFPLSGIVIGVVLLIGGLGVVSVTIMLYLRKKHLLAN
ncbi:hypothetical protein LCGC14_1228690 [marine sediment metagenome]|uniref:Uncharacterized protein n=1 Tax=marine sediment metagenome TaxID=412755 RepID=A0A0F9LD70_9ZZZZ